MNLGQPLLRVATPDDALRVEALMKQSTAALFPHFYDDRQTASAVTYVAEVDPMLLEDGTYFVIESGERDGRVRRLEQTRQALHGQWRFERRRAPTRPLA